MLKLAAGCEFTKITPDEILRDRLVFGIKDNRARERLLIKAKLTFADTDEISLLLYAGSNEWLMMV